MKFRIGCLIPWTIRQMSIFTDSLYFQFHLLAFLQSAQQWQKMLASREKGKKTAFFVFDDCSRNNSSSSSITTFTYYVHKFRFTFFLSFFLNLRSTTRLDSRQVCKYYCGFQSALIIMEIIFVGGREGSKQEDGHRHRF